VPLRLVAVYTFAGAVAGAAGALLAQTTGFASLDVFDFHRSAEVLLVLVIGGTGYLYGGIFGAIVFKLLHDLIAAVDAAVLELLARPVPGRPRPRRAASASSGRGRGFAPGQAMTTVLATRSLVKRFGGLAATNDVSLAVERGARHALIGPNGAGKTTLINLLTGVLEPTSGTITLDGDDITSLAAHLRVRRGVVRTFQINQLFNALTPLSSLALAVSVHQGRARAGGARSAPTRTSPPNARSCWHASGSPTSSTSRSTRSPTASGACSRSRWRSRAGRASCSSTSPSPAFPKASARRSSRPSTRCRPTSRSC
jgi:hypothetical protein